MNTRMKTTRRRWRGLGAVLPAIVGAAIVLSAAAAQAGEAEGGWRWRQEPGKSVALVGPEGVLWQFNFASDLHLPYFHPLATVDGRSLTQNSPPDHAWHHALWFAWKFINGVNYWETDKKTGKSAGRTVWTGAQITTRTDHTARIEMALAYRPAGSTGKAVMTERRVMETGAPDAEGVYHVDWTATFTAGEKDVTLDRTPIPGEPGGKPWGGYAGLSVRLAKDLADRVATSSDGPVPLEGDKYRGKHAVVRHRRPADELLQPGGHLLQAPHAEGGRVDDAAVPRPGPPRPMGRRQAEEGA